MEARDRLINCFAAVFPNLDRVEIPHITVSSFEGWDLLAFVTIIAVVQEEFGLDITPDDFDEISSFELILDLIARKSEVPQTVIWREKSTP